MFNEPVIVSIFLFSVKLKQISGSKATDIAQNMINLTENKKINI